MRKSPRARAESRRAGEVIRQLGIAAAVGRKDQAPKGYPVRIHNTTQPGAAYLVEYSFFHKDEVPSLRLFGREELTDFLVNNEEHAHHAGDEFSIGGMWRYEGPGKWTALKLSSRCSTVHGDFMTVTYHVHDPETDAASNSPGIEFTVNLDRRA